MTTDSFVVKPLRFPGGSIGELAVNGTVNDLAVAGARPLALSLSLILEEGLRRRRAARRGGGDRRAPPRRPASRSSPATRRSSSAATPTGCTSARPASGGATRAPGCRRRRSGPATGSCSRAASASTARRSCSRATSSSSTPTIESDTRSLWPAVDALLDAAGPGLRCLRDATRGGVASVLNELARASSVAMVVREAAVPVAPDGRRRRRAARDRPDVRRQRGQAGRVRRAGGGRRGARRAARACRAARRRPRSARCGPSRRGWCWWRRAFGGRRVMDQLVGDPLPRIC